jgi:hypothetical protein
LAVDFQPARRQDWQFVTLPRGTAGKIRPRTGTRIRLRISRAARPNSGWRSARW